MRLEGRRKGASAGGRQYFNSAKPMNMYLSPFLFSKALTFAEQGWRSCASYFLSYCFIAVDINRIKIIAISSNFSRPHIIDSCTVKILVNTQTFNPEWT